MAQSKTPLLDDSVILTQTKAHAVMALLDAREDRDIAEALGLIGYLGHDRSRTSGMTPRWRVPLIVPDEDQPHAPIPIAPSFGRTNRTTTRRMA